MKRVTLATLAEAAAVVLLGVGVGLLGVSRPINPFDEGTILVGAERIRAGELPFRDFYVLYPPGQVYAVAGVFGLFGVKALALRLYCVLVRALLAFVLYRIARNVAGRTMGAVCWCASIAWLTSSYSYGYPTFPALLLALTGLSILLECVRRRQAPGADPAAPLPTGRIFAAGLAAGAAALFRHDLAFYGVAASLPALFVLVRDGGGASARQMRASELIRACPYLAGMALSFGVPALLLLTRVPTSEVVFELFTFPVTGYASARGIPYPSPFSGPFPTDVLSHPGRLATAVENTCFYAPLLFDATAVVWFVARVRRDRAFAADPNGLALASMALLSALLFNLVRVRADATHVFAMVLPSLVVATALIRQAWLAGGRIDRAAALVVAGTGLLMLAWPVSNRPRPTWSELGRVLLAAPQPGRERTSNLACGEDREAVAAYLSSVVPNGSRIFVGCDRHDRLVSNDAIVYFLAARLPGTMYHSLDPGVATEADVQQTITQDLVRNHVEYVVLATPPDGPPEPNLSSLGGGSSHLDEYLRRNYTEVRRFGAAIAVWQRRTGWEH